MLAVIIGGAIVGVLAVYLIFWGLHALSRREE